MSGNSPPEERTIYVANFDEKVTEELLEELFVQAGPLVKVMVRDVRDSNAKYALVEFEDEATVIYAITLMNGVRLFGRELQVKPRNNTKQEEIFRRRRGEIEEIWRGTPDGRRSDQRDHHSRDNRRSGDYHRDQRDRERDNRDARGSRDWDRRGGDGRGNSSNNNHNDRSRSSGDIRDHRYSERGGGRNSGGGSSNYDDDGWMHQQQHPMPRHPPNRDGRGGGGMMPPPPPPPLMGGDNWRGSAPSLLPPPPPPLIPQDYSSPMLPHQHFVQMMQQQLRNSAPSSYAPRDSGAGRHQNSTYHQTPQNRQYDQRRGADQRASGGNQNHRYQNQNQRGSGRY